MGTAVALKKDFHSQTTVSVLTVKMIAIKQGNDNVYNADESSDISDDES